MVAPIVALALAAVGPEAPAEVRPQYHFTAEKGWLNDPNGLVYYRGEYHLFFQHNPFGTEWGNMTWGHAVSKDLVHWRQLDNALLPDASGTMFSGSAVVDRDNTSGLGLPKNPPIVLLYTAAGKPFTQGLAYSTDGGTFTKLAGNPVLAHIEAENRDPKVVWHAPTRSWIMALYLNDDRYALFRSQDLKAWERTCDVRMPGSSECPDFFELGVEGSRERKWVFWSANGRYRLGRFDGRAFVPDTDPVDSNFGPNCYAAQTYSDAPRGRRIQIAWMQGGSYPGQAFNQQMTLPRELRLVSTPAGLRLSILPVREMDRLRAKRLAERRRPGVPPPLDPGTDLLEVRATIRRDSEFAVRFCGQEVRYRPADRRIEAMGREAALPGQGSTFDLALYFDRTSLEVFADGGLVTMPGCFVPPAKRGRLEFEGRAERVTVYELRSALG